MTASEKGAAMVVEPVLLRNTLTEALVLPVPDAQVLLSCVNATHGEDPDPPLACTGGGELATGFGGGGDATCVRVLFVQSKPNRSVGNALCLGLRQSAP